MFNCTLIFITNIKFIQLLFLLFPNLSAIIIHVMVTQPFYFASFVWFVLEPEGAFLLLKYHVSTLRHFPESHFPVEFPPAHNNPLDVIG